MTDPALAGRCAIAVMAKAPREGAVKTRLVPPLNFAEAAQMSRSFLRDITDNIALAARQAPIDGYVAYAPAGVAGLFDGILADGTRLILSEGEGVDEPGVTGFGRCLLQTIRDLLAMGYRSAVVLNSDSPTLPTEMLVRTAEILSGSDDCAVLGPADDGGYYLLGATAPWGRLFAAIDWSTAAVAEQTRARAREIGVDLVTLDPWYDVDDRGGLTRLHSHIHRPALVRGLQPYPAPVTAATLASIAHLADMFQHQE